MSTFILAEPGSTHEGDYQLMLQLIQEAAYAGVDCFKNQWVSDAALLAERRHAPEYLESYTKLAYPFEWHAELRDFAHAQGLKYACSAYLPQDISLLAEVVDYLKISSFEASDTRMLDHAIAARRTHMVQTFVSLGMDTQPVRSRLDFIYLHCTSCYPAPIASLGLRRIANDCRFVSGLSDHSKDVRVGAWAVCAGATFLETHYRLYSTSSWNRDFNVSLKPSELAAYVANVRAAERAMGDGECRLETCEEPMTRFKVRA